MTNRGDGTVSRIDPESRTVTKTIDVGRGADAIAAGPAAVWVASPRTGRCPGSTLNGKRSSRRFRWATLRRASALSGKTLYVAVRSTGQEHRGGTLRALVGFPLDSIDPAFRTLVDSWSMLSSTNDGLVGFRRVGGIQGAQLVPGPGRIAADADRWRQDLHVRDPSRGSLFGRPRCAPR